MLKTSQGSGVMGPGIALHIPKPLANHQDPVPRIKATTDPEARNCFAYRCPKCCLGPPPPVCPSPFQRDIL